MLIHTITLPYAVPGMSPRLIQHAHDRVERALLATFGGFTAVPVSGAWLDDRARVVRDTSVRYESVGEIDQSEWMTHLACELADDLNQDYVLTTTIPLRAAHFTEGTRESL